MASLMSIVRTFSLVLMIAAVAGPIAMAGSTLLVHGEATVAVAPDVAQIDIGVTTQAASSDAATELNQKRTAALVQQLKTVLRSTNIKTINFSVNPSYRYPKEGGPPAITGYSATNTVRLELTNLSLLRKLIELATRSGATSINRLQFALRDEKAARGEALTQAADQARSSAQALAKSLQLNLGKVLHVEEVQPVIISPAREIEISSLKDESNSSVSLSPGNIQIHASINVTYETSER
jgi:uncharacterized protein YggE